MRKTSGVLAALGAAVIVMVAIAAWASVVPTDGYYRLTLSGSSSSSESTTTSPTYSIVYVSSGDSMIVGLISDSRATQASACIGELDAALSGNGNISGTRRRYYWYGSTGMNQSDTYTESFSGSFGTTTYASGSWSSSYYTNGTFTCSRPTTNPCLQLSDTGLFYWFNKDTITGAVGFQNTCTAFPGQRSLARLAFEVKADSVANLKCTSGIRLIVFNDSTGLVLDSWIAPVAGTVATDTLFREFVPVETMTTTRVWVATPAESGMQMAYRWLIAAGAGQATNYTGVAPVLATLDTSTGKRLVMTAVAPAGSLDGSCSVALGYVGRPNATPYLQADTTTGLSINGESDTSTACSRRIAGTTFEIVAISANGTSVPLATNKFISISIDLTHLGLNITDTTSLRLYRYDRNTSKWVSAGTNQNNTGNVLTCEINHLSVFAVLRPPSSSSTAEDDSSDCLITDAIGGTALARIMPSLRGVRDAMMANALGRLFVSGYYGISLMMLLAAGLGLTVALKRR